MPTRAVDIRREVIECGLTVTDFGVDGYPAGDHLAVLSGSGSDAVSVTNTPVDRLLGLSFLPFAGLIGLFSENFGGFVGAVSNFYRNTARVPRGLTPRVNRGSYMTRSTVLRNTVATCIKDLNPKQLPVVAWKCGISQKPCHSR